MSFGKKRDKKKSREDFIDDGRTIADMSVDGIPSSIPTRLSGQKRAKPAPLDEMGRPMNVDSGIIELSPEEKKMIRRGVIKAFLIYGGIGILAMVLIFLFLVFVWMR